jgi:hypothetical protein
VVHTTGENVGINAGANAQVSAFIQDVRSHLLHYATEAWIVHSPQVVVRMEEELRQHAASRVPVTALPSPPPPVDVYAQLAKYAHQVKIGTMPLAVFQQHRTRILTAEQPLAPDRSPSVSDVPAPSLQDGASLPLPSTVASESVPSPSPIVSEAVAAPPLMKRPVCQATVTAATSLVVHLRFLLFRLVLTPLPSSGVAAHIPSHSQTWAFP